MNELIESKLRDEIFRSYDEGFISGINSVSDTFKKLEEKIGDEKFTISEIIALVDSISGENAKLILESNNKRN